MKINKYRKLILNSTLKKSESTYQKVADSFEDDLLEYNDFPRNYFDFVIELLSEEKYYSKPGLWNFLLVIGTESHKLTKAHYKCLSDVFINNYKMYKDDDLCLAVCDFVARNYEYQLAKSLLLSLAEIEINMTNKGVAYEGLRILESEKNRLYNE